MAEEDASPPSSRDVAGEDFLFHLYRGSELLQDNRVHDAKVELEQALSMQPTDPKGQDLLAIVYFRLGLYPRAISIYEKLIRHHPNATTPRVNLALSYLKTGQPAAARSELERVIELNPNHSRAWGYLGLAYQRMGDYDRASHAFAAGGHDHMARRLLEMASADASASLIPDAPGPEHQAIEAAATEAFSELDRESGGFRPDSEHKRTPTGTWSTTEPGRLRRRTPSGTMRSITPLRDSQPPPSAPASAAAEPGTVGARTSGLPQVASPAQPASHRITPAWGMPVAAPSHRSAVSAQPVARSSGQAPESESTSNNDWVAAEKTTSWVRNRLVVFSRERNVVKTGDSLILARCVSSFATRLDAIRAMAFPSGFETKRLRRTMRGHTVDEPLGGATSPIHELIGRGELVLGASTGRALSLIELDDEPLYLRENAVTAFETSINVENGRLPTGDGDAITMLQLKGAGVVVISVPKAPVTIEVEENKPCLLRSLVIVGWTGRLVPRALPPSEAPAGVRGLVAFSGDGMVIIDAR